MKNISRFPLMPSKPSEDDIRTCAYYLYEQSNCAQGRDLENWLEAIARLEAATPAQQSQSNGHHHHRVSASRRETAEVHAFPQAALSVDF